MRRAGHTARMRDLRNAAVVRNLKGRYSYICEGDSNPLNSELNPICHLLALLGGATIVVVSRLRVKMDLKRVRVGGCGIYSFGSS